MQKSNFQVQKTIGVSAADAWSIIGGVTGVDLWLAPITDCRVEGNKRICSTEDGSFEEDILKIDHENRVFKYAIPSQHMVPVKNIIGSMTVKSVGDDQSEIAWEWTYDVLPASLDAAREAFSVVGNMGIHGIEQLIVKGETAQV
jgi:hypothetical protein